MHTKQRTLAWLLLVISMVPGLAFAERKGRLIGKVVDPESKPIEGVTVTAWSPEVPDFKAVVTTDSKGIFTLDFRKIEVTYHYRFDKTGYQSSEATQMWALEGTERFEWTLQPASSPVIQGLRAASVSAPAVLAYNLGVTAFKAMDYATAEVKFKEAVVHDPELRQAWEALSAVHLQLGHYQETADAAEKAITLGSTDETVLLSRWQAYRFLKDEVKAAAAMKDMEAIGRRAEEAKKIHNEAVALVKAGNHERAFAKFQEALQIDPNLQEAQLGLATAALKIERSAEAATAAETILKSDPGNEKAIRIRYNACLKLGDQARLIDALVGLAAFEPAVARNGLLRFAFESYDANDMVKAKERFDKVLLVDPNQPHAHNYLGIICAAQGATEEAKGHLLRFIELAPTDPEANAAREMLKYLTKP